MPHLKLASDFVRNGGLVFSVGVLEGTDQIANFKRVLLSFQRCYLDVSEKMKREILKVMLEWLVQLNSQVISKVENGAELLENTDFLQVVTTDLLNMLKDYFDSVRDAACVLLEFLITNFLRKSIVKD